MSRMAATARVVGVVMAAAVAGATDFDLGGVWTPEDADIIAVGIVSGTADSDMADAARGASLSPLARQRMTRMGEVLGHKYSNILGLRNENGIHRVAAQADGGWAYETGLAVMDGMFGAGGAELLVHNESTSDTTLAPWRKCTLYNSSIQATQRTYAYKELEISSRELRKEVAQLVGLADDGMSELWSMYYRLAAIPSTYREPHFTRIQDLILAVQRVESEAAKEVHLVGNLLREFNTFLRAAANSTSDDVVYKQWFGHREMMTAFGTLVNLNVSDIPTSGTSYIAELFRQRTTGIVFVKWSSVFVSGSRASDFRFVGELVHVRGCKAPLFIASLERYLHMTQSRETSLGQWCEYCGLYDDELCTGHAAMEPSQSKSGTGYHIYVYTLAVLVLVVGIVIVVRHFAVRYPRIQVHPGETASNTSCCDSDGGAVVKIKPTTPTPTPTPKLDEFTSVIKINIQQ